MADSQRATTRLVLVILRGGMDGLAAVPAYGDPHYRSGRGQLALNDPGQDGGILDLDGFFGLHPRLKSLHEMYGSGELTVIHGTAPAYTSRSHFDAQNVLESGVPTPHAARDGWLYRSLEGVDRGRTPNNIAMSVGASIPLVLRGERPVGSWYPDSFPDPDDDTMARLLALYGNDEVLGPSASTMMTADEMLDEMGEGSGRSNPMQQLAEATIGFLSHRNGPRIVVLENGGWDTHANQGTETGTLAGRLQQLDGLLGALRNRLGKSWRDTAIVVVTEFGRTVAVNGTRGTDHGVGGAAFLLGGAVDGGKVVSDWQGLASTKLFEGRDLQPGIDQRQLFKAVLVDHLRVDSGMVDDLVFPDSKHRPRLNGLFRGDST